MIGRTETLVISGQHDVVSEQALINRAVNAVHSEAWDVGECAFLWTQQYANGRSDPEFAELIGLSRAQVQIRRQVWERFSQSPHRISLTWSHFAKAVAWDDSELMLDWAVESGATVREMVAYWKATHGMDLFGKEDFDRKHDEPDERDEPGNAAKEAELRPSTEEQSDERSDDHADDCSGADVYQSCREKPKNVREDSAKSRKKREESKASKAVKEKRDAPDPDKISEAVDNMLRKYPTDCQVKSMQRMLTRILKRIDSIEQVFPPLAEDADAVTEVVGDIISWGVEQVQRVRGAEPGFFRKISDAFQRAALASAELASGGNGAQMALFDAGRSDGRITISEVLSYWNELWEASVTPTEPRRAALRSRCKDPFFVANWRSAMDHARQSRFCCGFNDRKWVATIDWFLRPGTVNKLLEMNYDFGEQAAGSAAQKREQGNADAIFAALGVDT